MCHRTDVTRIEGTEEDAPFAAQANEGPDFVHCKHHHVRFRSALDDEAELSESRGKLAGVGVIFSEPIYVMLECVDSRSRKIDKNGEAHIDVIQPGRYQLKWRITTPDGDQRRGITLSSSIPIFFSALVITH